MVVQLSRTFNSRIFSPSLTEISIYWTVPHLPSLSPSQPPFYFVSMDLTHILFVLWWLCIMCLSFNHVVTCVRISVYTTTLLTDQNGPQIKGPRSGNPRLPIRQTGPFLCSLFACVSLQPDFFLSLGLQTQACVNNSHAQIQGHSAFPHQQKIRVSSVLYLSFQLL